MNSNIEKLTTKEEFRFLSKSLPKGSKLNFVLLKNKIILDILYIHPSQRGCGTNFLKAFLAISDKHNLEVHITASPTQNSGDPKLTDLINWYQKFDFKCVTFDDYGAIMVRQPKLIKKNTANNKDLFD